MRCERRTDGGLRLELDAGETAVFRHLVERASFQDTPPEVQDDILRMADVILKTLGSEGV
ncbi:MAG: hypothetical protein PVF68_15365 [Acidobacteriota bacterium]|jgi:hypothetical protein